MSQLSVKYNPDVVPFINSACTIVHLKLEVMILDHKSFDSSRTCYLQKYWFTNSVVNIGNSLPKWVVTAIF